MGNAYTASDDPENEHKFPDIVRRRVRGRDIHRVKSRRASTAQSGEKRALKGKCARNGDEREKKGGNTREVNSMVEAMRDVTWRQGPKRCTTNGSPFAK